MGRQRHLPSDGTGNCLGWRDDLLTATTGSLGEKAVSNPVLVGGTVPRIIFTTLIPQTDACTAGGTSWLMELNPKTVDASRNRSSTSMATATSLAMPMT